nr:hypothetical protein [Streptomyces sp. S07_1.15]
MSSASQLRSGATSGVAPMPIVRADGCDRAAVLAETLVPAGAAGLEISLTTPFALEAVTTLTTLTLELGAARWSAPVPSWTSRRPGPPSTRAPGSSSPRASNRK